MTDSDPNLFSDTRQRRAWIILALVALAHAAFNLFLDPNGATEEQLSKWGALPLMGATLAQPMLFAIWAALAPGSAAVRIPWTLATCIVVFFATTIHRWNLISHNQSLPFGDGLLMEIALFAALLGIMLVLRWFMGWRIRQANEEIVSDATNQFSLRYLLLLTTLCAALLVVGRFLPAGYSYPSRPWAKALFDGLKFAGIILVALFPLIIIPLIAIARHPSVRTLIALPFLWAGLTCLMAVTLESPSEPFAEIALKIVLLQSGAAAAGLISAIAVRCAGYRLFTTKGRSSPTMVAIA